MLEPAIFPPQSIIDSWAQITEMPIVETAPRAVPLSCFIRYPTETELNRVITKRTPLPASKHEDTLQTLSESINQINCVEAFNLKLLIYIFNHIFNQLIYFNDIIK